MTDKTPTRGLRADSIWARSSLACYVGVTALVHEMFRSVSPPRLTGRADVRQNLVAAPDGPDVDRRSGIGAMLLVLGANDRFQDRRWPR